MPRVALLALMAALALLGSAPLLEGCYITDVGARTCNDTNCGRLTGSYQTLNGFLSGLTSTSTVTPGGINYEFFRVLAPTGYSSRTWVYLAQTAATDVRACCKACASAPSCQFFRFFPQNGTDLHQAVTNPGRTLAFTYGTPYPACNLLAGCPGYNVNDATKPCILFSLTSTIFRFPNGTTCTNASIPDCYPAARSDLTAQGQVVGPTWADPSQLFRNGSMNLAGNVRGKPRSYWGGSCNPKVNGTVKDDPHFVGGDGVRFDFNGQIGESFCLVTDDNIHINMHLGGYFDDRMTGASVTADGKAIRTWITALNIMWHDASGRKHNLYLKAREGQTQGRGEGFISEASVDGVHFTIPAAIGASVELSAGSRLVLAEQTKRGPFDLDTYNLEIDGVISLSSSLRVAHPLLQLPNEAFVHFNVKINQFKPTSSVHGVLGQTLREDGSRLMKALEYRMLTRLIGGPIQVDGDSGIGYLEGRTEDYITTDINTPDCRFSKYV